MTNMTDDKPKSALSEVIQHWLTSCLDTSNPPSKTTEELQTDSRTFFRYISKNTQVITDSNIILQTKSSHEEAIAQLIQDLGPAFTEDHHRGRLRALHLLVGAVEGCKETQLSNKVVTLLGKFLLGHCGPVDDSDYGEDFDTMIRDTAILALSSLVETSTNSSQKDEELAETMTSRMELARTGIVRRCAVPDTDSTRDPYGFRATRPDMRGGLSTLPRSKRAMAFELLQKTVTGISPIYKQMDDPFQNELVLSNIQIEMVEFAKFTANCLQGESDPRCLLQLLMLIHNMQVTLAPWFATASSSPEAVFPTEDIFDAVAPYYPVQFTPPPNDIHGITREKLHKALMSVLTCTKVDPGVAKFNRQPIMTLSADLFMESLLPPPEAENPGPLDKLEALECLSMLFFPEPESRIVDQMETRIAVSLSQALRTTHDEASLGVGQGGQMGKENKTLADECRNFVGRVAFQFEKSSKKELWDIFVQQPLNHVSPQLKSSPASCKTSIAYIACLASSGGSRTLRACLTMGLRPLLEYLEHNMGDTEDTAAATHGIGAFCSSCHVAMERAMVQGVVLHPHPLDTYVEKVAISLLDAFEKGDLSPSIKIGAVRGLDCLFLAAGSHKLSDSTMQGLCSFLDNICNKLTVDSVEKKQSELIRVYSMALGNILGGTLNENSKLSDSLLHNPILKNHVNEKIYPLLLAETKSSSMTIEHQGLKVLSIASSASIEVAGPIIASCLDLLNTSLKANGIESSVSHAQTLSYLLQHGGDVTSRAFHLCSSIDETFDFFIQYSKSTTKDEIRASVANLSLPDTVEEREAFQKEVSAVKQVTNNFLPAFSLWVPRARSTKLLKLVANILPPLSQADSFQLCVLLPLLAATLHASSDEKDGDTMQIDESISEIASTLIPGLKDVLTTSDFDPETRSAAGACLHAFLAVAKTNNTCPVAPIVTNAVAPTLCTTVDTVAATNVMQILALLASAAASRGGVSSTTADNIAIFLLEVACKGNAQLPFSEEFKDTFDSAALGDSTSVQLSAASAYGSILTVSTLKPLMKQRLMYTSLKFVKAAYEEERDQAKAGKAIKAPQVGLLAIVSHVLCNSDFARLDRLTLHQLCTLVIEGLSSAIFQSAVDGGTSPFTTASKNLVLAAVLKVICVSPNVVSP